jgi:hypothetical protein
LKIKGEIPGMKGLPNLHTDLIKILAWHLHPECMSSRKLWGENGSGVLKKTNTKGAVTATLEQIQSLDPIKGVAEGRISNLTPKPQLYPRIKGKIKTGFP